jgi:hypothetical protein
MHIQHSSDKSQNCIKQKHILDEKQVYNNQGSRLGMLKGKMGRFAAAQNLPDEQTLFNKVWR